MTMPVPRRGSARTYTPSPTRRRAIAAAAAAGIAFALAAPAGAEAATSTAAAPGVTASKQKQLLPKAMNGKAAIKALGDKLPEAARLNDRSPAALSKLLADDRTMWLDPAGHLFVQDTLAEHEHSDHAAEESGAGSAEAASFSAVAPLADTFLLHSRPSSTKKIFLDFDGIDLGQSRWGWTQKRYSGFDNDGDPATFDAGERAAIQAIWAQVAEDYAPFDVDVTTEDPGTAALTRSNVIDETYGMRVAITGDPSSRAQLAGCENSCGTVGIAYVGAFDDVVPLAEFGGPAWVFAYAVDNDPRTVAEIATHEVGHNLNLQHTNQPVSALWGSIMQPSITGARITQWVTDALTDQLNMITAQGVFFGNDEPGNAPGVSTSRRYTSGLDGIIQTPSDVDWYWVTGCRAGATITAQPADVGPNAALKLTLADFTGTTVASDAAATTLTDRQDATVAIPETASPEWYFGVEGVGSGPDGADVSVPSGFPNYGSLGRYSLDVVGCDVLPSAPSAPRSLAADTVGTTTTVSWAAPSFTGSVGVAALTYDVSLGDGPWTSVGSSTSTSFTTTSARQTVSVRARNALAVGPAATTLSVAAPQLVRAWTTSGGTFYPYRLFWTVKEPSGAPNTRITFYRSATGSGFLSWNRGTSGELSGPFVEGETIWVTLTNRVGTSNRMPFIARFTPVAPAAVGSPSASPDKLTGDVALSWTKPFDDGTGATLRYQVALDDGGWIDVASPAYRFAGVAPGEHTARIRAVNEVGPGPEVLVPFTMEAVDVTAPVISPNVSGTQGSNGWYVGDVTVAWDVSDPESSIASQTAGCATQVLSSDSVSAAYSCGATNSAGLAASAAVTVKRDATRPTLAPAASAAVVAQGGTVSVSANASDATSGIDTALTGCDAASTAVVGVVTVQCTATDNAGNVQTATTSYTVVNAFLGFQAPRSGAVLSASSTVSVRFTVGNLFGTTRSSTADVQVRFSTAPNGGGTVLVTRACTYSTTALAYQCSFKAPSNVSKGRNALPYYLTVFQRVPATTGPWYRMPNGTSVTNGNSVRITFK